MSPTQPPSFWISTVSSVAVQLRQYVKYYCISHGNSLILSPYLCVSEGAWHIAAWLSVERQLWPTIFAFYLLMCDCAQCYCEGQGGGNFPTFAQKKKTCTFTFTFKYFNIRMCILVTVVCSLNVLWITKNLKDRRVYPSTEAQQPPHEIPRSASLSGYTS